MIHMCPNTNNNFKHMMNIVIRCYNKFYKAMNIINIIKQILINQNSIYLFDYKFEYNF